MSEYLQINSKLLSQVKEFYKANKTQVLDIILYGSTVKGKFQPKDIDLLLLFPSKPDLKLAHTFEQQLKTKGFEADVEARSYAELFESTFLARENILSEGFSLVYKSFLHERFGFKSFALFKHSFKGLSETQRVRFQYALRGRVGKGRRGGMLRELDAIKFTTGITLVPTKNAERFASLLRDWKIEFQQTPILIPEKTIKYMKF